MRFIRLPLVLAAALSTFALIQGCSSDSDSASELDGPGKTRSAIGQCPKSPGPVLFGNALCLCGDFTDIGNLMVKSGAPNNRGSVAINGYTKAINNTQIDGSWSSGKGFTAIGNVNVKGSLYTPAELKVTGNLEVGSDLSVGAGMTGIGRVAVKGQLKNGGKDGVLGYLDAKQKGPYVAPDATPCACEGKDILDVANEIEVAKGNSDNGRRGLTGSISSIGYTNMTLKTGRYYFDDLSNIGYSRIKIEGAVAMYLDGSLEEIGAERFVFAPDSSLDLYVKGSIKTIGYLHVGARNRPSQLRVYIGGSEDVSISVGAQIFRGSVYAPKATIKYIGHTVIEGGLFANTVTGIGNLEIRGARPVPPPQSVCKDDGGAVESPPPATDNGDKGGANGDGTGDKGGANGDGTGDKGGANGDGTGDKGGANGDGTGTGGGGYGDGTDGSDKTNAPVESSPEIK